MDINKDRDNEINELRENFSTTLRPTVEGMEKLLYKPVKVLDHGFVRLIDYMGDDSAIVQAARVSYGKGTKKVNQDRGLIHYLMRHRHTTPFEMCDIKLHIKLPIFIARQWIRHRTASINEYSGRYSVLANEFYIPTRDNLAAQSTINMQGREDVLEGDEAQKVLDILINDSRNCYNNYQEMLNEDFSGNKLDEDRQGLARELARMNLPTNLYTEWYWKTNLHNLLNFLSLRADSHAQYEIRVYAEAILDMVKEWVPHTYDAFMEYRINGANLSGNAINLVKALISGKKVSFEDSGMTKREWQEVTDLLELKS